MQSFQEVDLLWSSVFLVTRVAGEGAQSSEVGESVDEGRLENGSTKSGVIKSLSQGQFAARQTRGVDERTPSLRDEMHLGGQFPNTDIYKHIIVD